MHLDCIILRWRHQKLLQNIFLQQLSTLDEEQDTELENYVIDNYSDQFEDASLDDPRFSDKRALSILVLEHALKMTPEEKKSIPQIRYPQILARKFLSKMGKTPTLRIDDDDDEVVWERQREELATNPERLPKCRDLEGYRTVTVMESNRISYENYWIIVHQSVFESTIGKIVQLLSPVGVRRVYARVIDSHRDPNATNRVYVSSSIYKALNEPLGKPVIMRMCDVTKAPMIQHITFRYKGGEATPNVISTLQQSLSELLSGIPAISLGQEFNNNNVRVESIRDTDNNRVFMGVFRGVGEFDIPFTILSRTEDVECRVCGRLATHSCGGCRVTHYCGRKCQHKDFATHNKLCNAFV